MKIDKDSKKQIEKIIDKMNCQKNFECYTSEFKKLSTVKSVNSKNLFECLSKKPKKCQFSLPFGDGYFCKCPLRIYIAKNLNK